MVQRNDHKNQIKSKQMSLIPFLDKDHSLPLSDRRLALVQRLQSVQAENAELKKQLKVTQKRLENLYSKNSQQGGQ